MKDSLSPDESMAVIEHLESVIADLKGLTFRERVIIAGYREGILVKEIADRAGCSPAMVMQTACRMRQRGIDLPRAVRSGTYTPPTKHPRYTVSGVTDMGHRIEVTSDSQADSDAHLAAMVADDG